MAIELIIILVIINFIWLGCITYFLKKYIDHYRHLTKDINKKSLNSILDKIISDIDNLKKNLDHLKIRCDKIEYNAESYIQKIGFHRFNPFNDTGGEQSFILVFTDARKNGIVITGLYSRTGVRWYVKKVHNGKGKEVELSDEEKMVLQNTDKIEKHAKKIT